jgi:hypothetical protein
MPNLKPVYDAALTADAEVKRILNEMGAAFEEGTDTGTTKALELRPALDEAKAKSEEANRLYVSMRDASLLTDNAAALFVPPADPAQQSDQGDEKPKKVINRSEFQALSPAARLEFIQLGGKIED